MRLLTYLFIGARADRQRNAVLLQVLEELRVFQAVHAMVNPLHLQGANRLPHKVCRPLFTCDGLTRVRAIQDS